MIKVNLLKKNTAVIIVDMQDFFLDNFTPKNRELLIMNQIKIIKLCVKNKLPFVILEYKCRGIFRGELIKKLDKMIKNTQKETIIKESNSGFTDTNLDSILNNLKIKQILLFGINANGCVQDTAIGAIRRGYRVITASGIIASSSRKDLELSVKNLKWYKKNTTFCEKI
jgi:nicotinamidase-related amidase